MKDPTHKEEENCSEDSDEEFMSEMIFCRKQNKTLKGITLVFSKQTCTPGSFGILVICWVPPTWAKNMNRNGNANGSQT